MQDQSMTENPTESLRCFKPYDVRGRIPDELNDDLAYRIGQAYARHLSPEKVVIGHDIRLSSPGLSSSLANGFLDAGVDVIDLGLCGTEEIYFATFHLNVDGGIIVTASHNPADYNGMKFVREGARPISGDTGLRDIERLAIEGQVSKSSNRGSLTQLDIRLDYIEHLLHYVDLKALKPLKIVVNAGNGCAGPVIDLLEKKLPFTFIKLQFQPDGTFPNGVPNPLLPENRAITAEAVRKHHADFGIAWDGDFDRCFLFDEKGNFIEGYYMVGLLARAFLKKIPQSKIIHDPRLTWNTQEIVSNAGGIPVMSKTGHAFIKERMRAEDAVYGGEMSAHHYFKDFAYCDSGMIPWLLVTEILSTTGVHLSELVSEMQAAYPVSGEINSRVADPDQAIRKVEEHFSDTPGKRDYTDGLSFETATFRFNIRKSNTEPVLRLNVESRGDQNLMEEKTAELLKVIKS
jgi:phosphomannomutase/phosphomannomutase/phosphoglucomutase